jgi:trk system potassium uptake protein TrkA
LYGPRPKARGDNPDKSGGLRQLGVDATVSSTRIIYNLIEQEIQSGDVIPLAALQRGNLEIVEIEIREDSPVLDKRLREASLPHGALLVCVIRNEQAMIPGPETRFEPGDTVIALVEAHLEHDLRRVFAEDLD